MVVDIKGNTRLTSKELKLFLCLHVLMFVHTPDLEIERNALALEDNVRLRELLGYVHGDIVPVTVLMSRQGGHYS